MAVNGVKENNNSLPPPTADLPAVDLPKLELGQGEDKPSIRKKVWDYLEKHNLVNFPRPVYNRIPNFKGANVACDKITELDAYKRANVIKVNPDKPQEQARFRILEARKTLLVPTPRLRSGLFNKITPPEDCGQDVLRKCATSQGVKEHSSPIGLDDQIKVDLVIIGSVAVSPKGWRIGKGEGFADLEYAMMATKGAVSENTCVVTAVHDCQVFDTLPDELFGAHDVTVDFIVTPTRVIEVKPRLPKPTGVIWSMLTREKFDQVPILKKLRYSQMKEGEDVRLKEELENNVALVEIKEQVISDGMKEIEIEESPRRERRQRNRRSHRRNGRERRDSHDKDDVNADHYTADNEGDDGERPRQRRNRRRKYSSRAEDTGGDSRGEDGELQDGEQPRPRRQNRNRRNRRTRRNTAGEEVQTGESGGEMEKKEGGERYHRDGPKEEGREGGPRRRRPRRNRRPHHDSEGHEDEEGYHRGEPRGQGGEHGDQPPRRRRNRNRKRRQSEHSDTEEGREYGSGHEGHGSPRPRRRGNKEKTPAVYIGSIPRKARVSEVKQAIRDRDVNPLRVIWHAGAARTFLLFTSAEEARAALAALDGLTIQDKPVRVELAKGTSGEGEAAPQGESPAPGGEKVRPDEPSIDGLTDAIQQVTINGDQ